MKYIIAIPDGAADNVSDFPSAATPLRRAETPTLDYLANHGHTAWAKTVPDGLHPGSDVACLSIFGYNPAEVYSGRAPLEAASQGIQLGNDVCFRCNLVTIDQGRMKEFTAGHISTPEARELIHALNSSLSQEGVRFYPGVQYRHLMVAPAGMGDLACTPPHDILDQEIEPHQPHGASADPANELMLKSREVLAQHPVNQKRIDAGKPPATQIWLWGQGTEPAIQPYDQRIGLAGGVITAVDLIRGIGKLAGLRVIEVEGATGLPDTNFEGKAQAALDVLQEDDFVCIHVEATDEMGHQGDLELKTQSARDFDQRLVRHVIEGLNERGEAFRILVLPDHPTPLSLRTHTREPVPFLLYDSRNPAQQGSEGYSEIAVRNRSNQLVWGYRLLDALAEKNSLQEIEVNQPAA